VASRGETSYASVSGTASFEDVVARMSEEKAELMLRHRALLDERYDLGDRAINGLVMSGGKSVQGGEVLPESQTSSSCDRR
jgi:hypothetical protein